MVMKAALGSLESSSSSSSKHKSMGEEKDEDNTNNQDESSSWIDLATFHTEGMDYSPRKNAVLGSIEDKKRDSVELLRRAEDALRVK